MEFPVEKVLILTLTRPQQTDSFKNHITWFGKCVALYNEKSELSTVNKKKIEIISISDKEIKIKLFSETNLGKAPGRALIMLSRMLITREDKYKNEYDTFFEENIFHGKLFTISEVKSDSTDIMIEVEDVEVVKALMDYVTTPKSLITERKRRAFEEIKRIAVESNILELGGDIL